MCSSYIKNNNDKKMFKSGVYIVSTPIGNLEDITFRAIKLLKNSDLILCEDTRRSSKLLSHYNIKTKLIAYHKFNEKKKLNEIIEILSNKKVVSLISDAGTPLISDPGIILIQECIKKKIDIYPIPGASSITSAISVSGFDDKFLFYGFLSKNENNLNRELKLFSELSFSIIIFIPALKLNYYLEKFKQFFPERKILIAKEMTKLFESYFRAKISEIKKYNIDSKGELTIVISNINNIKRSSRDIDESVKLKIEKMLKKYSNKDVAEFISKQENLSKKKIYQFCIELKKK